MYYNGDLKVSGFKRNFCTMIYVIYSCPFDVRVVNNIKDIFAKIDLVRTNALVCMTRLTLMFEPRAS